MNSGDEVFKDGFEDILGKLSTGISPSALSQEEENILIKHYGRRWLEKLGYNKSFKPKPIKRRVPKEMIDENGWITVIRKK